MESGAARVARLDGERGGPARALLFVDADLGATAADTAPLAAPVLAGEADLTIAVLPAQSRAGGGRGLVVGLSRRGDPARDRLDGDPAAVGHALPDPGGLRGGPSAGPRLGRRDRDDDRPAARRLPGARGAVRPAAPGDRLGLARPAAPGEQYRDVARALAVRRLRRAAPLRVLSPPAARRGDRPDRGPRRARLRRRLRPRPRRDRGARRLRGRPGPRARRPRCRPGTSPPAPSSALVTRAARRRPGRSPRRTVLRAWWPCAATASAGSGRRTALLAGRCGPRARRSSRRSGRPTTSPTSRTAGSWPPATTRTSSPPVAWRGGSDPVAGAVQPPWQSTPSVYGPVATAAQTLAAVVGDGSLRRTVWAWQLLAGLAFLGGGARPRPARRRPRPRPAPPRSTATGPADDRQRHRAPRRVGRALDAQPAAARPARARRARRRARRGVRRRRARASPRAARSSRARWSPPPSATKAPFALVGLALVWGVRRLPRRDGPAGTSRSARSAPAWCSLPAHLWTGPHTYDQLHRASRFVSFATPWRLLVDQLDPLLGRGAVRSLVTPLAAVLAVALAALLARRVAARSGVLWWTEARPGTSGAQTHRGRAAMTRDAVGCARA